MSKKQKNIGVKALCSVLIVLLLATIGIAIPSKGFTDWSKFKKNPQVEQPDKPGEEQKPGTDDVVIEQIEASGILLSAAIASADETGVTQRFTATITPSDATNQQVNWSVAFKNAGSEWANGKNISDYVTVTPTSDGSLYADVTCKAAFGEQIILTVTSRDNAEAKATATVDYRKKVIACEIKLNGSDSDVVDFSLAGTSYNITATPVMSVGTLGNEQSVSISGRRNAEWYNGVHPSLKLSQDNNLSDDFDFTSNSFTTDINFAANMLKVNNYNNLDTKFKNIIKRYYVAGIDQTFMEIVVTLIGEDGKNTTFTKALKIGAANFNQSVEGITLDKPSIIF